jgi:hypothetical protein
MEMIIRTRYQSQPFDRNHPSWQSLRSITWTTTWLCCRYSYLALWDSFQLKFLCSVRSYNTCQAVSAQGYEQMKNRIWSQPLPCGFSITSPKMLFISKKHMSARQPKVGTWLKFYTCHNCNWWKCHPRSHDCHRRWTSKKCLLQLLGEQSHRAITIKDGHQFPLPLRRCTNKLGSIRWRWWADSADLLPGALPLSHGLAALHVFLLTQEMLSILYVDKFCSAMPSGIHRASVHECLEPQFW